MLISIDRGSARNSCNSQPKHARWSAQRAYNGQLLQLLHALRSGSIVPFVLVVIITIVKCDRVDVCATVFRAV